MSATVPSQKGLNFVSQNEQPPEPVVDKAAVEAKEARRAADVERQSKMTPEELEAARSEFAEVALGRIRRPKEEKPKKEEVKEESKEAEVVKEPDKPAKEVTETKGAEDDEKGEDEEPQPTKKAKAKKVVEPTPSLDAAVATAVAHGVKEAVTPLLDKLSPKQAEETVGLSEKDKKRLEVIRHLESTSAAHKGLTVKTLDFWRKEAAYKEAWEAKHEGETFDPGADEHTNFYTKNEPNVTEEELESAKESLIESRLEKKLSEKHAEKLAKIESERRFETRVPQIERASQEAMLDFVPLAVPAFGELMKDGDTVRFSDEIIKKMQETDPEAFDIVVSEGEKMRILHQEFDKIAEFPDYKPNPRLSVKLKNSRERFFPHAEIDTFITDLEGELASQSPDDSNKDGRSFITHAEYQSKWKALSGDNEAKQQEMSRRYWWLTPEIIKRSMVRERADSVQEHLKRFEARDTRRAKSTKSETADEKAAREEKEAQAVEQKKQEEQPKREKSPNAAIASDRTDTSKKGVPTGGISEEVWMSKA